MSEQTDRLLVARLVREGKERSGVTWHRLAGEIGLSVTHLKRLAYGVGIPSTEAAAVLAERLASPNIATITARIRERTCERCGSAFVCGWHGTKQRFCSRECQRRAQDERLRGHTVRGMIQELADMTARAASQSAAIAAFCASCEPDGYCGSSGCELRAVSPLPLSRRAVA